MTTEEGYIKFNPKHEIASITIDPIMLENLNTIRNELLAKDWLGVLPNGISFGNISYRDNDTFCITASGTGALRKIEANNMSRVTSVDVSNNSLSCTGQSIASSESMSHAIFYEHNKDINAVIHIHSSLLWKRYLNKLPTSNLDATYGTPEMAFSLKEQLDKISSNAGVIIMGGHLDGIIAFGDNLTQILKLIKTFA